MEKSPEQKKRSDGATQKQPIKGEAAQTSSFQSGKPGQQQAKPSATQSKQENKK